jgi:hypothetical protein
VPLACSAYINVFTGICADTWSDTFYLIEQWLFSTGLLQCPKWPINHPYLLISLSPSKNCASWKWQSQWTMILVINIVSSRRACLVRRISMVMSLVYILLKSHINLTLVQLSDQQISMMIIWFCENHIALKTHDN